MATLFWLIVFLGACLALIYNRIELRLSTAIIGAVLVAITSFSGAGLVWLFILWVLFAAFALLNVETLRRERISAPILAVLKKLLPRLSDTERAALEAGSVWWEGELFSGMPDWRQLTKLPAPKLTEAEQAFLDGPTEELCALVDEWAITHDLQDMPEPIWDFIREKGFFSLIIPEEYGGKGFSPLAISMILAKLASHSGTAATTIGVPNSLGPAELLLHYGTEEQKQRWLPGLAACEEIPCFALTSIHAGSDATGLVDSGVVCKGEFDGEEIVGVRLNWDKRYITLAPVATVLGLAFKLYDPDHLIGERDAYGITAALIPTNLPGVETGRRHLPIGIPFLNGPTRGQGCLRAAGQHHRRQGDGRGRMADAGGTAERRTRHRPAQQRRRGRRGGAPRHRGVRAYPQAVQGAHRRVPRHRRGAGAHGGLHVHHDGRLPRDVHGAERGRETPQCPPPSSSTTTPR